MTTDPKSYEAQRKHVLVINSPKFPGGVMRGYVAEIDYRTLERELSDCRAELGALATANNEAMHGYNEALTRAEIAESRLASHAEREGMAEQEPCAWRYRYGKTGMWKYADRAEDTNQGDEYEREPLYPLPWLNPAPSAVSELAEAVKKYLDEVGPESWWTAGERRLAKALRSHQAPVGEGWISVKERLPVSAAPVLVEWIMDDSSGTEVASFNGMGWYHEYNFAPFFKANVTHWMPLPPAPDASPS